MNKAAGRPLANRFGTSPSDAPVNDWQPNTHTMSLAHLSPVAPIAILSLLATTSCQKSTELQGPPAPDGPDKTLALDLEGRWTVTSLEEDGEELVGRDALYTYATLDFDYEGDAGGNLEIALASTTSRLYFDGDYRADAARATLAFEGEASYAYGEASAIVEAKSFELGLGREHADGLTLAGSVGGNRWAMTAVRD